jgi:flavin-dependent dehydrogenase
VRTRIRGGAEHVVRAALTVGADGLRSGIARAVDARPTWRGAAAGALVYGYWAADQLPDYHWFYRPGGVAGVIPTNDGRVCIWAGLPAADFAVRRRGGLDRVFTEVLADVAPSAAQLATGERVGPLRGFPGAPALLREAAGPGWALVGDAGSFKDPLTAHGITDALRDAELLARAAEDGSPTAFADYGNTRDALTLPLLRVAEEIAAYRWDTPRIKELLRAESAAMKPEVAALRALDLALTGRAA